MYDVNSSARHDLVVLHAASRLPEEPFTHVGRELGSTAAHHARGRMRASGVRGVLLLELPHEVLARGISVHRGDAPHHRSVGDVDDAQITEERHGESGEMLEPLGKFQQRREHRPAVGEESLRCLLLRELALGLPPGGDVERHAHHSGDRARCVEEGRVDRVHRDDRSVLVPDAELALPALARRHRATDVADRRGLERTGRELRRVLPLELPWAATVEHFAIRIGVEHCAVEGCHEHPRPEAVEQARLDSDDPVRGKRAHHRRTIGGVRAPIVTPSRKPRRVGWVVRSTTGDCTR